MTACSIGSVFEVVGFNATSVSSSELLPHAARSRGANKMDAQLRTAHRLPSDDPGGQRSWVHRCFGGDGYVRRLRAFGQGSVTGHPPFRGVIEVAAPTAF